MMTQPLKFSWAWGSEFRSPASIPKVRHGTLKRQWQTDIYCPKSLVNHRAFGSRGNLVSKSKVLSNGERHPMLASGSMSVWVRILEGMCSSYTLPVPSPHTHLIQIPPFCLLLPRGNQGLNWLMQHLATLLTDPFSFLSSLITFRPKPSYSLHDYICSFHWTSDN